MHVSQVSVLGTSLIAVSTKQAAENVRAVKLDAGLHRIDADAIASA
jgi:hypothetical protein